jgi:hypothetical protein
VQPVRHLLKEKMHDLLYKSRDEVLQSLPTRSNKSLQAIGNSGASLCITRERAREVVKEHLEHTREIAFTPTAGE